VTQHTAPALRALVLKEIAISAAINAVLSIAFFLIVFGRRDRLTFWAPDYLAIDFIPQFAAVSLMSALVPAFVARKKLARASGGACAPVAEIILRAVRLCLAAVLLAGALIGALGAARWDSIDGTAALFLKAACGAALGMAIAKLALTPLSRGTTSQ
jgi:hypothetical protein